MHFVNQIIDRKNLSDYHISHDIYTELFKLINLSANYILRQTKFRNSIYKHASGRMKSLKNRNFITHFGKIRSARKSGRT